MDKRSLSERDICTKFITPALRAAGYRLEAALDAVEATRSRLFDSLLHGSLGSDLAPFNGGSGNAARIRA